MSTRQGGNSSIGGFSNSSRKLNQAAGGPRVGANLAKSNPSNGATTTVRISNKPDPTKCLAYGPGLEGSVMKRQVKFLVEARNRQDIRCPRGGAKVEVTIHRLGSIIYPAVQDLDDGTYEVVYTPDVPGEHKIEININGEKLPNTPRNVKIYVDNTNYVVKCILEVYDDQSSKIEKQPDNVLVTIKSPNGEVIYPTLQYIGEGKFRVSYTPTDVGDYVLDGFVDGKQVEGCPYIVTFAGNTTKTKLEATHCIAYGPGLHDLPHGELGCFTVETRNANDEPLPKCTEQCTVEIWGPAKTQIPATIRDNGNGTFGVEYEPKVAGPYVVNVMFNRNHVLRSPFNLQVKEPPSPQLMLEEDDEMEEVTVPVEKKVKEYQARVSGIGAQKCIIGTESQFVVETFDENGDPAKLDDLNKLKVHIKGPKGEVPYTIQEKDFNLYVVKYQADLLGELELEIEVDEKIVRAAPKTIVAERDAIAYGPGLESPSCDGPQAFIIETFGGDTLRRKPLPTDRVVVSVKSPNGQEVPSTVKNNQDGTYTAQYSPKDPGPHTINASFNDRPVLDFPRKIDVAATNLIVSVHGPGTQSGYVGEPSSFRVEVLDPDSHTNTTLENPERLEVQVFDPNGKFIPADITLREDGGLDVEYTPSVPGDHVIHVLLDDKETEGSPIRVPVKPKSAYVLPAIIPADGFRRSQTRDRGADGHEVVQRKTDLDGDDLAMTEEESHLMRRQPSKMSAADPPSTFLSGPGVSGGTVGQPAKLEVQLRDVFLNSLLTSTEDEVSIKVRDPNGKDVPVRTTNRGDGTYQSEYDPATPGDYTVDVELNNVPITRTPFKVPFAPVRHDVVCSGPGLESPVQIDLPTTFEVAISDPVTRQPARDLELSAIRVDVSGPDGNLDTRVEKTSKEGVFLVGYTPTTIGKHCIDVRLNEASVAGAPFNVMADTKVNAATSVAYGPGLENNKHPFFYVEARDPLGRRVPLPNDKLEIDILATPNKATGDRVNGPVPLGVSVKEKGNGAFHVEYATPPPGSECSIAVKINGEHISKSPFKYKVAEPSYQLAVQGQGVTGGRITPNAVFTVEATNPNTGARVRLNPSKLKITVTPPGSPPGYNICEVTPKSDDSFAINYDATKLGEYKVDVEYDGVIVPSFPRTVVYSAKPGNNPGGSAIKIDQNLQLQKEDDMHLPEGLKSVKFGLGWSYKEGEADLDASVVMTRYSQKLDHAFFKDTKSLDGAVVHSGDNRSGGDGITDDESINVDLTKVSSRINCLMFVVNVYDKNKTFSLIKNAYVRLTNNKTGKELCRYTLNDCGNRTCLILCKIYRFGPSQWKLKVLGASGGGNVFNKSMNDIVPFLDLPPPARIFEVRVHEAKDLPRPSNTAINPYCFVQFDDKKEKSKVVKASVNPIFEQSFKLKGEATLIEVNIFDKRNTHLSLHGSDKDTFLGRVNIPVPIQTERISFSPQWLPLLYDAGTPAPQGQVKVSVTQIK